MFDPWSCEETLFELGNWLMPFSTSQTRHVRLGKCFFFGGLESSSDESATSSRGRLVISGADMVLVVDVEGEKRLSRVEEYIVV